MSLLPYTGVSHGWVPPGAYIQRKPNSHPIVRGPLPQTVSAVYGARKGDAASNCSTNGAAPPVLWGPRI